MGRWSESTLIPLLTKLASPKPHEWYRYIDTAQQYLNAVPHRSTGSSPFQVLLGTHPRLKDCPVIREILEKEQLDLFQDTREELRTEARKNIVKMQRENKRSFDKRRKKARDYREGELVAIRRTQRGPGTKLAGKFLGPYEITRVLRNHRYMVQKIGESEGPNRTTTSADYMKPWSRESDDYLSENEDEDEVSE